MIGKFSFPSVGDGGRALPNRVLLFVSFTLDPMLSSVWPDPPTPPPRQAAGDPSSAGVHRPLHGWPAPCLRAHHALGVQRPPHRLWWPAWACWTRGIATSSACPAAPRISPAGPGAGAGWPEPGGLAGLAPLVGGEAVPRPTSRSPADPACRSAPAWPVPARRSARSSS